MSVGCKKTELIESKRMQFTLLGQNGPEPNVRFGSKADIEAPLPDVSFTPKSGHHRDFGSHPRIERCIEYGRTAEDFTDCALFLALTSAGGGGFCGGRGIRVPAATGSISRGTSIAKLPR